jgi:hypothetical protein
LAGFLALTGIGYTAALSLAYLSVTPRSLLPDVTELDRLLFRIREKPTSTIERLLEATEGPMNGSGTMRPAFTRESLDWSSIKESLTPEGRSALLAEREGERLALLEWVRTGADRGAYENDNFTVRQSAAGSITPHYLVAPAAHETYATRNVRICTLIHDRCVTCHSAGGSNDKACWFPLDTYENFEPYCRAESEQSRGPNWPLLSLLGLLPMTLLSGPIFFFVTRPSPARAILAALPLAAVVAAFACWLLGRQGGHFIHVLLAAGGVAALGVIAQIFASLTQLFAAQPS